MAQSDRQRRFSSFTFDLKTGDLTRHGIRLHLEHQPKEALRLLIEANGDLVSRAELRAALWPLESEGDFNRRLDKAIAKLRICLNDDPQHPRYIETLRGLGYRLLVKAVAEQNNNGKYGGFTQTEEPFSVHHAHNGFGSETQETTAMLQAQRQDLLHCASELASAGLAFPCENCFAAQEAAIRTGLLFKAVVTLDTSMEWRPNALGARRLAIPVSGWFEGPLMKGEILPGSIDWQWLRFDNVTEFESQYALKTHDSVPIRVVIRGCRHGTPEAIECLAPGEMVNPVEYFYRATPIFEAPSGPYDWLNSGLFICTGERHLSSVVIYFHEILQIAPRDK
jgi:DNA-binding winged helix-turn-helix (wHTH) protein